MNNRYTLALLICLGVASTCGRTTVAENPRRLNLDEALAIALELNPDIAVAQARMDEAKARLRAARAGAWPALLARGAYDYRTEDQRLLAATRNAEQGVFGSQILGAELVLNLPLYTGGRVSAERDTALWRERVAADQLTRTRESLVYHVAAVFYGLLVQDEVLRSLETAVQAINEQQRIIQAMLEADKAARVDLLRANVRQAELQERRARELNERIMQQRAWAALLGLDDYDAPEARGRLAEMDAPACDDSRLCMRRALDRRADYRAARAAVAATEAAVRAARAGHLPKVHAQAAYGMRWMPDPVKQPEGTDDRVDLGRVGLAVELPIFDGYLVSARVAEHRALARNAREQMRKMELQIRYEVETAWSAIDTARERLRTSGHATEQARESFRIIQEKYDLGMGALTDLLDAQTALVTAETNHARALADLSVAVVRRDWAIGEILP